VEIDFFNSRSVLVFICLLQGAVFAALLFWRGRKRKNPSDRWLAALLILLCSGLITPFIGFANVYNANQWLTYFPFYLAYSYGGCIYLYVLSLTNSRRKFQPKDLLFFVPTAIYIVFRFILFAQSLEFKNWFDEKYYVPLVGPFVFVTEFIWNGALLFLSLRHYRKYRAWTEENFSDTERIKFDWLRNFLYIFTFVFVAGGVFDFTDSFLFNLSYVQIFYFQLVLALTTYYLAIAGYLRSETIHLNFEPETIIAEAKEIARLKPPAAAEDAEFEKLKIKLEDLMRCDKPYLEPQLTLADLSKRIGLSATALSQIINQGFGKNFNDFINEYRVGEIKEKIQNGATKNLNLLGVALECGFNSKATFNRAFKKITGVSPKEFKTDEE
jgi:AraC-like DNA-binding protein